MKKDTYTMEYQCFNCTSTFRKKIPKGTLARGSGGICPICGVEEGIHQDPNKPNTITFLTHKIPLGGDK